MPMTTIFVLLITFQIKHFLADYVFQTSYMLKKSQTNNWILPLLSHSLVHGFFTLFILITYGYIQLWYLFLIDIIVHFLVDAVKARPQFLGRFNPSQKQFWISLGFDQMLHHLTHYFFISQSCLHNHLQAHSTYRPSQNPILRQV